jgi:hypothetical protein
MTSTHYPPIETWSLYIGELVASSRYITKSKHKKLYYPTHFHAQCSCEGCIAWTSYGDGCGDSYGDSYGDSEIKDSIIDKIPFNDNTIILPSISKVNVSVIAQKCPFTYDAKLEFAIDTDGNFIFADIKNIRNKLISNLFGTGGGNEMKIYVHFDDNEDILTIKIYTTCEIKCSRTFEHYNEPLKVIG